MELRPLTSTRRWVLIVLAASPVFFSAPSLAQVEASKPAIREAVEPAVRQQDLSQISLEQTVKVWQPGDQVRVVEDLKSNHGTEATAVDINKPVVREPVKAETEERELEELPVVEPHEPGGPVREVEDLKLDEEIERDSSEDESEEDPAN